MEALSMADLQFEFEYQIDEQAFLTILNSNFVAVGVYQVNLANLHV